MLFHSSYIPEHAVDWCLAYEQLPQTCFLLDSQGRILFVNQAGIDELGYQREQLNGHVLCDFVHAEDRVRLQTEIGMLQRGQSATCSEYRFQTNHGDACWMKSQVRRVQDKKGLDLFILVCNQGNHKEEEKHRLILENISDLVMVVDRFGNLTYISPSHHTELGLDIELMLGQVVFDNIHSVDLPEIQHKFLEMLQTKTPRQATFRHQHTNGTWMTCEAHGVPVLDENGEVEEVVIVSRDITVRQRVQDEIAGLHRQYQAILDSAGEGIYRLDLEGTITYCNPAVSKMTGYEMEELMARSPHELFLRSEQDTVYWRKSGEAFPVESISKPLVTDGVVDGTVVTFVDVTERNNLEDKRRRKEERIRKQHATLLNLHHEMAHMSLDEALQRLTSSVAKTLNVDRVSIWTFAENRTMVQCMCLYEQETEAFTRDMQVQVSDFPTYFEALEQDRIIAVHDAFEDPRTAQLAAQFLGLHNVLSTLDAPIRFEGKIIGLLGMSYKEARHWTSDEQHFAGAVADLINIVLEKEERQKTEELLRKSEKLSVVGQLAAGVAHEIRNPLTSLRGFVQLLQEQPGVGKEEYYSIMLSELDRINLIVGEFLLIAKPQVEHYQQTPVSELIQTVVTLIEPQAMLHNVQIHVDIPVKPLDIECDPNKLKQVFINVLKNSIEAMPTGGEIVIQVRLEGEHVQFCFVDQGGGIREERLPKLGEPFYTTKEKGTGLGLMVSYRIIEAHKGKISIESELGTGTKVNISLPVPTEGC